MVQSYPFDLLRTPLAIKKYNLLWSDSDLDGTAKFKIMISSDCPDNISDCINSSTGALLSTFTTTNVGDIKLNLTEYDESSTIGITDTVEYTLSDDIDVKGVFLVKKSNDFVLGYCINPKPLRFCDKLIFEENNILYTING